MVRDGKRVSKRVGEMVRELEGAVGMLGYRGKKGELEMVGKEGGEELVKK